MNTFNIGDRVEALNGMHRVGVIEAFSEASGLFEVSVGGNRCYYALADQIMHEVPDDPKFNVQVMFTNGEGFNTEQSMCQKEAEQYLLDVAYWGNVESITINRVTKG